MPLSGGRIWLAEGQIRCGGTGLVIVRADSAFYNRDAIAAVRRAGARFSITVRQDPVVRQAIASIPDDG